MISRGDWLVVHVEGDSERKVNTKYGSGTRAPLRSQPPITVRVRVHVDCILSQIFKFSNYYPAYLDFALVP